MQIIIAAGGGGTRLWPLSTDNRPKQFAKIIQDISLIENVYNNLTRKFSPDQVWISTNAKYKDLILEILPKSFESSRLILEPTRKNTFAGVACAAAVVASKTSKKETLCFVPCDDYMYNQVSIDSLNESLEILDKTLQSGQFDFLTTVIKPTNANPNYGYVQIDKQDRIKCFSSPAKVLSFIQKPNEEVAEELIQSGNYLWNKFNPTFCYQSLEKLLKQKDIQSYSLLQEVFASGTIDEKVFEKMKVGDFDIEVLQSSESFGALGLDVTWDDIGNWSAVYKHLPKLSECQSCIQVSGTGNKFITEKKRNIAFVGVSNLLVVDSQEGLLIVDPRNSGEIRKVSEFFSDKINKVDENL